jgi:hypothetical protein
MTLSSNENNDMDTTDTSNTFVGLDLDCEGDVIRRSTLTLRDLYLAEHARLLQKIGELERQAATSVVHKQMYTKHGDAVNHLNDTDQEIRSFAFACTQLPWMSAQFQQVPACIEALRSCDARLQESALDSLFSLSLAWAGIEAHLSLLKEVLPQPSDDSDDENRIASLSRELRQALKELGR